MPLILLLFDQQNMEKRDTDMFGLSTQEVEMKNVFAAYKNCSNVYYESIKRVFRTFESKSEIEQQILMMAFKKEYFDASKDMLFDYLRTQYQNFDSKFENALIHNNSLFSQTEINQFREQGFSAGTLFYFVYLAISGKEPKPQNCIILNRQSNEVMNRVLGLIDNK